MQKIATNYFSTIMALQSSFYRQNHSFFRFLQLIIIGIIKKV